MNEHGTKTFSNAWSDTDARKNIRASSTAEPLAVIQNVEDAIAAKLITNGDSVEIATDHQAIVWSASRGWGKTMAYNRLLEFIAHLSCSMPATRFTYSFVPGSDNPADRASRGLDVEEGRWDGAGLGFCDASGRVVFATLPSVRIG
jgi:hypothetical protein